MTNRYNSFKFFVAELFSKIKENGDIANESFYTLTIKNLIFSRDDWYNADNAAKDRLFERLSMDVPNNLGVCYENGDGVTQNMGEAVKWYRKAADQGNASAQYNLGRCYYYGYAVTQDMEEAVKWYRKAADQGNAYAQRRLENILKQRERSQKTKINQDKDCAHSDFADVLLQDIDSPFWL